MTKGTKVVIATLVCDWDLNRVNRLGLQAILGNVMSGVWDDPEPPLRQLGCVGSDHIGSFGFGSWKVLCEPSSGMQEMIEQQHEKPEMAFANERPTLLVGIGDQEYCENMLMLFSTCHNGNDAWVQRCMERLDVAKRGNRVVWIDTNQPGEVLYKAYNSMVSTADYVA